MIVLLLVVLLLVHPGQVSADGPLGPDGTPISTSDYTIDLYRGPVLGTSRMIGLGGAVVAIAEGVEGGLVNPAAAGYRQPQWPDWYDYWLAFSFTYPFGSGDYFNSGTFIDLGQTVTDDNFFFFVTGFLLQFYQFGFGLTIDNQTSAATTSATSANATPTDFRLGITTYHIPIGYGFADGQIILGAGIRVLQERVRVNGTGAFAGDLAYKTAGVGTELGLMIRPHDKRWRIGASLYPRLATRFGDTGSAEVTSEGDIKIGRGFVPRNAVAPMSGSIGFSFVFGPRPTNPRWVLDAELAAPDLEMIQKKEDAIRRRHHDAVEKIRAEGGPDVEKKIADINKHTEAALGYIKRWRKDTMYAAWKVLRERYRNEWPRHYLLVTTELKLTGKVTDGVGVVSFFSQTVQRSGQEISVSPRIGVEGEVWPKRMKLRAGTYWEPSRFAQTSGRQHGTIGLDIRVLHWDVFGLWPEDYLWQVTFAVDLAHNYQVFSLGIGGWY